jgi:hypothetical protein
MSVSAIFSLLLKLVTVAPHLWPLIVDLYTAAQALADAADEALGNPVARTLDADPELDATIAAIERALPEDGARKIGDGKLLQKLGGLLKNNPELAAFLFGKLTGVLTGK